MAKPGSQTARSIARGRAKRGTSATQARTEVAVPDVTELKTFVEHFESALTPSDAMRVLEAEYPLILRSFRAQNWRFLGIEPAPAPGGTVQAAVRDGWYKLKLQDGSDGYLMRRSDDCSTATVATLAGCHPSIVPDPHEMRRILDGDEPEQVMRDQDESYGPFAAKTGIRLRCHHEPPWWSKRWIAVVERDPDNPLANHLMVMSGRTLLMDPANIGTPMTDEGTALDGWGVQDISFGYTLD